MPSNVFISKDRWSNHIFLECSCWSHAVEFIKFHGEEDKDEFIYLNFWFQGHRKVSLIEKLKAVWKILTKSDGYYFDEIIIGREAAEQLKQYLEEALSHQEDISANTVVLPNISAGGA